MPIKHVVQPGECTDSIAYAYGFFADTVWNAPENDELRAKRKFKNVLSPGDVLVIPDKRQKIASCPTGGRHVFRRRGIPARIRLQFMRDDQPQAGVPYILEIDGQVRSGMLDDQGQLDAPVMPNARTGKVVLRAGAPDEETRHLQFRRIEPIDTTRGQQARLRNLGFYDGEIDGVASARTEGAIRGFQAKYEIEVTGQPDDATLSRLETVHGC